MLYKENTPLGLTVLQKSLCISNPLKLPHIGYVTSRIEDIAFLGRSEGVAVDKHPKGVLRSGNEFAGGSRSAFCPIDDPVWGLRDVPRTLFERRLPGIHERVKNAAERIVSESTTGKSELKPEAIDFSRQMVLRVIEELMFGFTLEEKEAVKISNAYKRFNSWCAIDSITGHFADIGRLPKLDLVSILNVGQDEAQPVSAKDVRGSKTRLSSLVFDKHHKEFNECLITIANHSAKVWSHLESVKNEIYFAYKTKATELGLEDKDIVLELTNVIGGAISSPSAFLAFSLSVFGRLPQAEQDKIKLDFNYRHAFYLEVQRLYQPLPWIMRDIKNQNWENDSTKKDRFVFFTFGYNRNPKIWGPDAGSYNPSRFIKNTHLSSNLVFFGKGRRRCPVGKFGEEIAASCFESLIQNWEIDAKGPLKVGLAETISPKGKVYLKRSSN